MKKAEFIWLSTTYQSNFESLKLIIDSVDNEDNLRNCLWYSPDEKKEAEDFLKGLKRYIFDNYKHKESVKWLTEDWVNENTINKR